MNPNSKEVLLVGSGVNLFPANYGNRLTDSGATRAHIAIPLRYGKAAMGAPHRPAVRTASWAPHGLMAE